MAFCLFLIPQLHNMLHFNLFFFSFFLAFPEFKTLGYFLTAYLS